MQNPKSKMMMMMMTVTMMANVVAKQTRDRKWRGRPDIAIIANTIIVVVTGSGSGQLCCYNNNRQQFALKWHSCLLLFRIRAF